MSAAWAACVPASSALKVDAATPVSCIPATARHFTATAASFYRTLFCRTVSHFSGERTELVVGLTGVSSSTRDSSIPRVPIPKAKPTGDPPFPDVIW